MNKRVIRIGTLIIGLLLLAGAYGWLIRGIGQERQAQAGLEEQLTTVGAAVNAQSGQEETLPTLQAELADLQAEQTAVQADLVRLRTAFPTEIDSTAVLEVIVNQALVNGVNLRQLTAQTPVTATVQAGTYRLLAYDIQTDGTLTALGAFFNALENGPISTLSLKNIKLTEKRPADNEQDSLYQATLLAEVLVRMTAPGEAPLPPNQPDLSAAAQLADLTAVLAEAETAGDWERAISLLLVMRQLDAADPVLVGRLANAYVQAGGQRRLAGQLSSAAANFEAALKLEPENEAALAGIAAIYSLTPSPTPTVSPLPEATTAPNKGPLFFAPASLRLLENGRYPDLGCDWFGIVGKLVDSGGNPISGVAVRVWSPDWPGTETITQANGEYEVVLGDSPQAGLWLIQLSVAGDTASDVVSVQSVADCTGALIELDWQGS